MKIKHIFAAAFLAAASFAATANAGINNVYYNAGLLTVGDVGITAAGGQNGPLLMYITGQLDAKTSADFSFTLLGGHSEPVNAAGLYSTIGDGHSLTGTYVTDASGYVTSHSSFTDATPIPTSLVLSTADIAHKVGPYNLTNSSLSAVNFAVVVFGFLSKGAFVLATWSAALSNIPLPAAAPLFGLAMAGLAWAKRKSAKA